MSNVPDELRYTREHEWARLDETGKVTIGITDFAQEQLGDVVYLDLPAIEGELVAGESMGEIESTKSVSDLYSPLSGTVDEINLECRDNPAAVNQDPYGSGWMVVILPTDVEQFDELLSSDEYESFLAEMAGEDAN